MRPAASTPRPLSRERDPAEERKARTDLRSVPSLASIDNGNNNGLAPAKAIQTNNAPLARRKTIQTNEGEANPRLTASLRIEALRIEIRQTVAWAVSMAEAEKLNVLCDKVGSYSRHKAAQAAVNATEQAAIRFEEGLMWLERSMPASTPGEAS